MTATRTVHFLIVDDDDVDAMGMERAFKNLRLANPRSRVHDGIEALELLRAKDGALPEPRLVLLDLNMPRMDGLEFLAELRADPDLSHTVVFVLTTSAADEDRLAAYKHNIAGYIVKSDLANGFMDVVELLSVYWRVVELP